MLPTGVIELPTVRREGMSTGESTGQIHSEVTRRSKHHYLFYNKHHGQDPHAARWLPDLSRDEEFAVFDDADFHDLSDDRGWLYGIRRDPDGRILELGTWNQQIAEYPFACSTETWHGYPLWPLKDAGPENRRGERFRPSKVVFLKMEAAELLSKRDRKRLMKGDYA